MQKNVSRLHAYLVYPNWPRWLVLFRPMWVHKARSIVYPNRYTIHRLEKTTFLALKRAINVDLLLIFSVIIALRKLKESVPRGLGLQINLPVLKLPMRHKLCLALYSTAVGDISRPLLWRIIMTLRFSQQIFHSDQFEVKKIINLQHFMNNFIYKNLAIISVKGGGIIPADWYICQSNIWMKKNEEIYFLFSIKVFILTNYNILIF